MLAGGSEHEDQGQYLFIEGEPVRQHSLVRR